MAGLAGVVAGLALQTHVVIVIFLQADALTQCECAGGGAGGATCGIGAGLAGVAAGLADLYVVVIVVSYAIAEESDVVDAAVGDSEVASRTSEAVCAAFAYVVAGGTGGIGSIVVVSCGAGTCGSGASVVGS